MNRERRATRCRATLPPTATPRTPLPPKAINGAPISRRTKRASGHTRCRLRKGKNVAVDDSCEGRRGCRFDGASGSFSVAPTDKTGRDFRAKGRLQYVGEHYLQFAGTKEYFLKAGADAPENLLAYRDFDGDFARPMATRTISSRIGSRTCRIGSRAIPTWQDGKGKGIIGAVNYLAGKGANAVSFLTMNIGGDDQNVFPYVSYTDYAHLDVSRLEQWEIVFDHAQKLGLFLHFKTQEAENQGLLDGGETRPAAQAVLPRTHRPVRPSPRAELEHRRGDRAVAGEAAHTAATHAAAAGDGGVFPPERPVPSPRRHPQRDGVRRHPRAEVRNTPAFPSSTVGAPRTRRTLEWLNKSDAAGKPWAVANDEQNPADMGVPPDPGYTGHSGEGIQDGKPYTMHDVRKSTLWGICWPAARAWNTTSATSSRRTTSNCQDFRSRDKSWDYCRIALEFFRGEQDSVLGNEERQRAHRQPEERQLEVLLRQSRASCTSSTCPTAARPISI